MTERKEILARGRFINLSLRGHWEYAERHGVSGIVLLVPETRDGRLVLVEQYRPPVAAKVVELPAGLVGDGDGRESEDLETAARRELLEETGYEALELTQVAEGCVSAGITDERLNVFVARDLVKRGAGGGDESEDILVHEVPIDGVPEWLESSVAAGKIIDLKIFAGLYWLGRAVSPRVRLKPSDGACDRSAG